MTKTTAPAKAKKAVPKAPRVEKTAPTPKAEAKVPEPVEDKAPAPEPVAAVKAPEPVPEPVSETCSVCGAPKLSAAHDTCLAHRS